MESSGRYTVARYQLDYILIRHRYRNSVKNARAMPVADVVTMKAQIKLKYIKRKRIKKRQKWNKKNLQKKQGIGRENRRRTNRACGRISKR